MTFPKYNEDDHAIARTMNSMLAEVKWLAEKFDCREMPKRAVAMCDEIAERLRISEVEQEPGDDADAIRDQRMEARP